MPAGEIQQLKLNLIPADKANSAATVGFRFTYGEENTLLWVLAGRTDAGAMADYVFNKLSVPVSAELRVIHQSKVMPYHVVVIRPGASNGLRSAIHRRLLTMDKDPEGRKVLQAFEKTTRFDDIPVESLHNLNTFKLDF